MEAFEHAVHDCGTDMLEIDVHLTLDKQVQCLFQLPEDDPELSTTISYCCYCYL